MRSADSTQSAERGGRLLLDVRHEQTAVFAAEAVEFSAESPGLLPSPQAQESPTR